jgi:hypothetical protein
MSVRWMRDPIMLAWNWSLTSELYFRLMENCGKTAPTKKIGPIWQKSLSSCNFSFDTISQILDFYISIVTVKDGISIFLNRWPIMARTFSSNDWQIKVESEFHEISLFPWKKTKKSRLLLLLLFFTKTRQHLWYKKWLSWSGRSRKWKKKLSERHLQLLAFLFLFIFFVSKCDSPRIQSMVPINGAFSLHLLFLSFCLFFFLFSLCLLMRKMKEENGFLEQYSTYVCLSRKVQRGRLIWDSIKRERQKPYFSTFVLLTVSFKSFEVVVSLRKDERTTVA